MRTTNIFQEIQIDDQNTPSIVAQAIRNGELVAINYTGSVYAIIFDCRNPKALKKAQKLKNRYHRSFTIHANLSFIEKVINRDLLNHECAGILSNLSKVKNLFGAKYIMRIPIDPKKSFDCQIPPQLLGVEEQDHNTMHIISMETGEYDKIQQTVLGLLEPIYQNLTPLLGMSSFNYTGEGSQNNPEVSRKLALDNDIPVLVHPKKYIEGLSYDIVSFTDPKSWTVFRSQNLEKSQERLKQLIKKEALFFDTSWLLWELSPV
jgi:hypothetical protein